MFSHICWKVRNLRHLSKSRFLRGLCFKIWMYLFMWMEQTFVQQQINMCHKWHWCDFCHSLYYCCHCLSFGRFSDFFIFTCIVKAWWFVVWMFSNSSLSLHGLWRELEANNCNYFHVHRLAVNQESEVKVCHWWSTSRKNYRVKSLLYILLV